MADKDLWTTIFSSQGNKLSIEGAIIQLCIISETKKYWIGDQED